MGKQKDKKQTKRSYLNLTISLSLIIAVILPVLTPSFVSAALEGAQAQQDRTILYALIRCIKGEDADNYKEQASGEDIREDSMSGITNSLFNGSSKNMAVGYEIDGDDGNATCSDMSLTRAMRPIHQNPRWFFEQVYDLDHPTSDDGSLKYNRRGDSTVEALAGKLNREIGKYDLSMGRPEKLRRLATAFWVCAEPAPDPPDRDTTTYGGKEYQLRSDAPNEVSVGYDMEGENGKLKCSTLMNWGDKDEMADALRQNPQGSTAGSTGAADPSGSLTDCDTKLLNPLSWIICPLIDIGSGASDYIFQNIAKPLLQDVPIELKSSDGAYSAWQGFRFLANIMIIGTMLVIVYVQARGGPS